MRGLVQTENTNRVGLNKQILTIPIRGAGIQEFPKKPGFLPKMTSTKVIYHLEGEPTPYMVKILVSPDCVTLEDFKHHINPPNALDEYKYIFKTEDEDFGCVVKIEVHNDEAVLPKFENKVIAWLTGKTGTMRTNTAANSQTDLTSYMVVFRISWFG